jgi:AraC-like DNA-binding protein
MVGKALGLLHQRPAHAWTLDELAREVASSRSKFAERFTWLVGEPPMQYLAKWRMQLAANHLAQGSEKVAAVGSRVGYESEAAFSRAFKKATACRRRPGGRPGSPSSQVHSRQQRREARVSAQRTEEERALDAEERAGSLLVCLLEEVHRAVVLA